MSISLADLCEEDSDSDDQEYIPDEGRFSEESYSGSDGEELAEPKDDGKGSKKKRKKEKSKTRRGVMAEEEEADDSEEERQAVENKEEEERKEKARIDDLWASFKQETSSMLPRGKGKAESKASASEAGPPPKKIKIQETYDFAGEAVTVEKEVDMDSKKAKKFFKSDSEGDRPKLKELSTPTSSSKEVGLETAKTEGACATVTQPLQGSKTTAPAKVKSSGLSSVLSSIGKKQKMSTLDKSSLDWKKYKDDHGLNEELARHSKDGYLEKLDFLHRADMRQFELEREQRLKRFKKIV